MHMRKIKNSMNAHEFPKYYEKVSPISETVPDQTLSIKEILDRYSRGLTVNGEKFPVYHGEEEMPYLEKMDISEIRQLQEDLEEYTNEKRALHEEYLAQEEQRKAEWKEKQYVEFEEWQEKRKNQKNEASSKQSQGD